MEFCWRVPSDFSFSEIVENTSTYPSLLNHVKLLAMILHCLFARYPTVSRAAHLNVTFLLMLHSIWMFICHVPLCFASWFSLPQHAFLSQYPNILVLTSSDCRPIILDDPSCACTTSCVVKKSAVCYRRVSV